MLRTLAFITLQQWRMHKLRTTLTVLGIALGVAVFFALRTANLTLLSSLKVTIEKLAGKATLQIVAGEAGFPEAVWDTVRDTPGVKIAEPVIEVIAHTAFADEGNLLVVGVDMVGDGELREYQFEESESEIGDPLVALAQPDSILISRSFADKHQLKEGDKLPLFTSQGRKQFVIRGIIKPAGIGEIFGGQIAVMDIFNAQFVFNRGRNFDRIDLMNAPDVPVEVLQERLRERLPAGIEVVRPASRGQGIDNAVSAVTNGFLITSFIALLVGVFIIFNSFSISVNQRWKEIGILRAIGVERAGVQRMFLGEAVVMGLLGSLLGVIGGFYLAVGATRAMNTIATSIYGLVSSAEMPTFHWDYAVVSFVIGVIASLVAAWLPARAASRLDPVLALHNIETRQRESVVGWKRLLAGLMMIAAGLALIRLAPQRVDMWIQFVYAGLLVFGMIVVLPKLSAWIARALRPLMDWAFGSEGVLAIDTMIQSPRRTSATVGALMIGLSFVFSSGAFISSEKRTIIRSIDRTVNSDLIVTTSEGARSRTYHFSEELGQRIAALPGVKRIEQVRFTFVPYNGDTAAIVTLEMEGFFARVKDVLEEGDEQRARELIPKGEGFLVAHNFATRWQVGVGDRLKLETPTGMLERPVLGLMEDYSSEKGTIFMDRALYKTYWKDSAVDFIDINLKPGVDPAAFKTEVQRIIAGEQRAFIYTNQEYKRWIINLIDGFFVLNYMQMIIAVLVAALGIVNTLIISVSERKREFGVIRAIGGLRRQVRKMVLLEAVAIAIVGLITGAIAGILDTYFLVRTAATIIGGFTLPFEIPIGMMILTLPIVIVISLIAAWMPARHAVNLRVIEAIGYE
jgi:putative ABC transport system permease protein